MSTLWRGIVNNYYVYMYLREDGTPYYVGKGKGNRAYKKSDRVILPPNDKSRIKIVLTNLTEEQAFVNEKYFIAWYGRKDNNTGILRNLTDGGEGSSGAIISEETKKKHSVNGKGKKRFLGRTHRQESKEKMTQSRLGQKWVNNGVMNKRLRKDEEIPDGYTQGRLYINIGRIYDISGEKNPFYGKKHSVETREKMSASRRSAIKCNKVVVTDL